MEPTAKKAAAIRLLQDIRGMEPAALHTMIVREAGEELAQFFLAYSAQVLGTAPERMLENASSLMLMGYLIRSAEEAPPGGERDAAPGD